MDCNDTKEFFMKRGAKIVVLGAGSYFFGRPLIYNMVSSPILRKGTLALVDIQANVLDTMLSLAHKAKEVTGAPVEIIGSTERKEVMKDADFVVLSFSYRNSFFRETDTRIAKKYGVTMCSSDTIGPGGIFRAMRELPEILRVAKDVRSLAPDAWLINFINPSAVMGIGLMRYAPEVKSFALCDGNHLPYSDFHYLQLAGALPEDLQLDPKKLPFELLNGLDLRIAGVNHCTFITHFNYKGKDLLPQLHRRVAELAAKEYESAPSNKAKPRLNFNYALQLMDVYGLYPTAVSHTKEYVPFFQGYGKCPVTPEPIIPFDGYNRQEEMDAAWKVTSEFADGKRPIEEFMKNYARGDHATDIIESMWGNLDKEFFINGPNQGAVSNLPDDAFLELRRKINMDGFQALPVGKLPHGVLGLTQQVLDTHELTVEAIISNDKKILYRAMASDPIVNNLDDAKAIMNELLEAERQYLPKEWYD
jgi:alpha-galactosidase